MTLNMIKLCVGIEDVEHLAKVQSIRLKNQIAKGEKPCLRHVTRNHPRRANEILDGGSLYWVIKGFIRVRQPVIGFEDDPRDDGKPYCAILLDNQLIKTELKKFRAFQGWRYFKDVDAPKDLSRDGAVSSLPDAMAEELKELGLI